MNNLDSILKKQRHSFADKGPYSQSYGFSSSHVWMWELDHKESWVLKIWCFWTVVLKKTLENPLDCKKIKPVNPKGSQSWIFIGRTDGEAEIPIVWPPFVKNWPLGKDPDAGKDCREEKGTTEDEMDGWHHWLDGHEFEQAPGVGDGQGSLACCSLWGRKELDVTEWLNWTELKTRKGFEVERWHLLSPYFVPGTVRGASHTSLFSSLVDILSSCIWTPSSFGISQGCGFWGSRTLPPTKNAKRSQSAFPVSIHRWSSTVGGVMRWQRGNQRLCGCPSCGVGLPGWYSGKKIRLPMQEMQETQVQFVDWE